MRKKYKKTLVLRRFSINYRCCYEQLYKNIKWIDTVASIRLLEPCPLTMPGVE